MFGLNALQAAGAALMAVAGVAYAFPYARGFAARLGGGGESEGAGLTEADLRRANDLCFELGAIARKSSSAVQRERILESKHAIEGALTVDPFRTVKAATFSTGGSSLLTGASISGVTIRGNAEISPTDGAPPFAPGPGSAGA
jgi:hypothetical protein